MTIAWPMVTAVCLTLALINLRIAQGDNHRVTHLFFATAAIAVAVISWLEMSLFLTTDIAQARWILRWASVPLWVMEASVAGFVWSFFGRCKIKLALAALAGHAIAQIANVVPAVPGVREVVGLRSVHIAGGVRYTVPEVVNGPWALLELLSIFVLSAFVLDASITQWKRGDRRRAVIVGGGMLFFLSMSRAHAYLVETNLVQTPYLVSFSFLGALIAMGIELGDDVLRAASLARDLHESERRMELAAKSASLGFWTLEGGSGHIWANETARHLFEIPMDEPVDVPRFLGVVHPEDREGVKAAIEAAFAGDMHYEKEYRLLLAGGRVRWIAARGKVEESATGDRLLMRGVLHDITTTRTSELELQQVRGQLTHAGRVSMMGQLASALAHELNQPLGAILRNAEAAEIFLQANDPNLDEVRAIISDIRADDQRAGEVINRLRALLKRRDIESYPLAVNELLAEVLALVRADASARGIKLEVVPQSEAPAVLGDRVHLQQVLINLVINSMDALSEISHADRGVVIQAQRSGADFVEVTVMDNGPGIPQDRVSQVFDPFFTTKPHGMGMGLPISRTIIEAHGGRISVENGAEGGAIFRFTLPVAEAKNRRESAGEMVE